MPLIKEMARYVVLSGGKRLRSLLTVACAKMAGYGFNKEEKRHIGLAVVIEFIHTATLVHDDVVDESKLRRGKKSANEVWGNKPSVLVGDFIFSKAFELIANDRSEEVLKLLSNTSVIIAEGEMLEIANDKDITISDKGKVFNTELLDAIELEYLLDMAEATVGSALERRESRGAHTREDYPDRDDKNYLKHSFISKDLTGKINVKYKDVELGRYEPMERKY